MKRFLLLFGIPLSILTACVSSFLGNSPEQNNSQSTQQAKSAGQQIVDSDTKSSSASNKESWTPWSDVQNSKNPAAARVDAFTKVAKAMTNGDAYNADLTDNLYQLNSGEYFRTHDITVDKLCLTHLALSSAYDPYMSVTILAKENGEEKELSSLNCGKTGNTYAHGFLLMAPGLTYRVMISSEVPGEVGRGVLMVCRSGEIYPTEIDSPSTTKGSLTQKSVTIEKCVSVNDGGTEWIGTHADRIALYRFNSQKDMTNTFDLYLKGTKANSGSVLTMFDSSGLYIGTAKRGGNRELTDRVQFLFSPTFTAFGTGKYYRPGDSQYLVVTQGGTVAAGDTNAEISYRLVAGKRSSAQVMMEAMMR